MLKQLKLIKLISSNNRHMVVRLFLTLLLLLPSSSLSYLLDHEVGDLVKSNQQVHRNKLSLTNHLEVIRKSAPLLKNKTLTVCVIVREPFVIFNGVNSTSSESDINNYSGIAIEVVKRLSFIFKFSIRIIKPADNQFGILVDGRWTGLIGSLVNREADIGLTALSITVGRAQVIDFTRAYYVETAGIMLRIPEELKNYSAIFDPFALDSWILLLTTVVLLVVFVTIMTRLEESEQDSFSIAYGTNWLERFYYAVTCVINIFLIRGEWMQLVDLVYNQPLTLRHSRRDRHQGASETDAN